MKLSVMVYTSDTRRKYMANKTFRVTEHKVGEDITPPEYNGDPLRKGDWEFVSSEVIQCSPRLHTVFVTWKRIGGGQ